MHSWGNNDRIVNPFITEFYSLRALWILLYTLALIPITSFLLIINISAVVPSINWVYDFPFPALVIALENSAASERYSVTGWNYGRTASNSHGDGLVFPVAASTNSSRLRARIIAELSPEFRPSHGKLSLPRCEHPFLVVSRIV